jgi:magnesium transporter
MSIDNKAICQLYKYDTDSFFMKKDSPNYFAKNFVAAEIDSTKVAWLNYHDISNRQEIEKLCENLTIEKMSVDDIYTSKHRPKVEEYGNYVFFSIRSALSRERKDLPLEQEQISFILGKNYLVSFQEKKSDHFVTVRDRLSVPMGKIRTKGADYLLFRMLDAIIDNYFEVLDDITENVEKLETLVFRSSRSENLKRIELEKRKLVELRKIVIPMKDVATYLEKAKNEFIDSNNYYYFSDLKDNCLSVLDEIEVNKHVLDGVTNLYYAVQGQRMNEIMKLLTVVSAIFIPLTFIVGLYGMNFEYIPELKIKNGYFYTLGLMGLIVVILIFYFKKRGWLGKVK